MCPFLNPDIRTQRGEPAAPCNSAPRFALGRCVYTPNAAVALTQHNVHLSALLCRHATGDYGVIGVDSVRDNERAIPFGGRVVSLYRLPSDDVLETMTPEERRRSPSLWIITDGGVTTALTERDL